MLTPNQLSKALDVLIDVRRPGMIWGMPGIGKSDIVRSVAAKRGINLVDKRLAQSDPTELKGYPVPDLKAGTMRFLRDELLPTKGEGILFLDELPQAPLMVQAAAYQLVLDRKLGTYELPEGWIVLAAGNRAKDRSISNQMPAALANRFVHLDVRADPDDWQVWAAGPGKINAMVRGYLRFRPSNLCVNEVPLADRSFPTPRSWEFASRIIEQKDVPQETTLALLSGTLGEGLAAEITGYIRDHSSVVNIDQIMMAPTKAPVPEGAGALYAVCAALQDYTTLGNIDRVMEYVERLPKEFQSVYMSSIMVDNDLADCQAVTNWIINNRNFVR